MIVKASDNFPSGGFKGLSNANYTQLTKIKNSIKYSYFIFVTIIIINLYILPILTIIILNLFYEENIYNDFILVSSSIYNSSSSSISDSSRSSNYPLATRILIFLLLLGPLDDSSNYLFYISINLFYYY